jgi:hypothetical protein
MVNHRRAASGQAFAWDLAEGAKGVQLAALALQSAAEGRRVDVAAADYDGYVEVEIFNAVVWAAPPDQTAAVVRERFAALGH